MSNRANLKDGSSVEINNIDWDLINEGKRGNIAESYIGDFEIYEEK